MISAVETAAVEVETETAPTSAAGVESPAGDLEDVLGRAIESVVSILSDDGRGSGFLVDGRTVITNYHVVGSSESVLVKLANGNAVSGSVERVSELHDLALVRLDRELTDRPSLTLTSADSLRVGQDVYVIGSPMGVLESSVTRGIVSAIRPYQGGKLVQTDAAINPGNSGGPLLDRTGKVAGIATMKVAEGESIGFAVAADHAKELLEGGGTPASERSGRSLRTGVASAFGGGSGSSTPASPQEAELQKVIDDSRAQFMRLAQVVGGCPDIARDFQGKTEDEALFHLGEIVLEYVNQRRIYATNGRYIPSWNRLSCLQSDENVVAVCYQAIAGYDALYKAYLGDLARKGETPRRSRQLPQI
jgi:hypothetical protein